VRPTGRRCARDPGEQGCGRRGDGHPKLTHAEKSTTFDQQFKCNEPSQAAKYSRTVVGRGGGCSARHQNIITDVVSWSIILSIFSFQTLISIACEGGGGQLRLLTASNRHSRPQCVHAFWKLGTCQRLD
jgi:hypothetical protein